MVAVSGLSLTVGRGECFGLLGPNGAGKTTTIEILEGLLTPDEGEVEVLGLRWGRDEAELRQRLGIQLQETRLAEKLTVEETLWLFRAFYRRGRTVDELLRVVELESKRASWVGKLSGGQRQRLALACALAGAPDLLFLDEPTTGRDPQSRRQLWGVLDRFRADGGTSVLTTHYMDEAEALCDRVAVVDHGRVMALGTPKELIETLGAHADPSARSRWFRSSAAFSFTALGLLTASRPRTLEAISGILNLTMLPMWVLSGVFFSTANFPASLQPFIQALPLTALNDALRAVILEGASVGAVGSELLLLAAWGIAPFVIALRFFRWA